MKIIHLCADDFGLNEGVSKGILTLLEQQRLSAVSCMVECEEFSRYAQHLSCYKNQIQIGLHFDLTENYPFSLTELLIKSHLNVLPLPHITHALQKQLDQFVEKMGFFPHFIDGHQHVHQLPRIRQQLLAKMPEIKKYGSWIRSTVPSQSGTIKALLLALSGGWNFQRLLKKNNVAFNSSFEGIYNFDPQSVYRTLFRTWLSQSQEGTLIMCHPGYPCSTSDAIAATRSQELAYFLSPQFLEDCEEYQCKLYYS